MQVRVDADGVRVRRWWRWRLLPWERVRGVNLRGLRRGVELRILATDGPPVTVKIADAGSAEALQEEICAGLLRTHGGVEPPLTWSQWQDALTRAAAAHESLQARLLGEVLLGVAVEQGVSDIHIQIVADGGRVAVRTGGLLRDLVTLPLEPTTRLLTRVRVLSRLPLVTRNEPLEGSFGVPSLPGARFRASILPTPEGAKASIRVLCQGGGPNRVDDLGYSEEEAEAYRSVLREREGLIVVCGPAGSGKTTTLYAGLREIVALDGRHVVTLEDPVEYPLPGVTQVPIRADQGLTYAKGLAAALRHDPEVLMVGEVRDADTANIVLQAALTGHLVLATVHAGTPLQALQRLLELNLPVSALASSLRAVVCQRLVRRRCPDCGPETSPACPTCLGSGYRGVVPLVDGIWPGSAWGPLLERVRDSSEEVVASRGFRAAAEAAVNRGVTTREELSRVGFS